jgi:hypothetical protein
MNQVKDLCIEAKKGLHKGVAEPLQRYIMRRFLMFVTDTHLSEGIRSGPLGDAKI